MCVTLFPDIDAKILFRERQLTKVTTDHLRLTQGKSGKRDGMCVAQIKLLLKRYGSVSSDPGETRWNQQPAIVLTRVLYLGVGPSR